MSAERPRELRLVECEECERLRGQIATALVDLENAEADVRALRRQLAAARADRSSELSSHPNLGLAERLFEFWKEETGHERAQLGPKRLRAILARLEKYDARDIAKAIRGAAKAAYVDERGVRHDDIELICRDEVKLEKFIERYENARRL